MNCPITPKLVFPMLEEVSSVLYRALDAGIEYADSQQPDDEDFNSHYWSHSARFTAHNYLAHCDGKTWKLVDGIPNFGVHITLNGVHKLRVVKSINNGAPSPGRNKTRQIDWVGYSEQLQFELPFDGNAPLPPLSLLVDWNADQNREPIVHVSLPNGSWKFGERARVHWRELLTSEANISINDLAFTLTDDGDPTISIETESNEFGTDSL
jgi:hypothetical protein